MPHCVRRWRLVQLICEFSVLWVLRETWWLVSQIPEKLKKAVAVGGENPGVFPNEGAIFQLPFSLPESAQTLAGIALRAAFKSRE